MSRLISLRILLAAIISVVFTVGISTAEATSAFAAQKGNCTPFLSVTPSTGKFVWVVRWAGSSSRWSPPGALHISATATWAPTAGAPMRSLGTVYGTTRGTSVSTSPGGPALIEGQQVKVTVKVTASGPAGTTGCSKTIQ